MQKTYKIGHINLTLGWSWRSTWIVSIVGIIWYLSSWEIAALALLSHVMLTWRT